MEIERARLTKTLATIKEQNGEVKEAASILQELQVTRGVVTVTSVIELMLKLHHLHLQKMPGMRLTVTSEIVAQF